MLNPTVTLIHSDELAIDITFPVTEEFTWDTLKDYEWVYGMTFAGWDR